MSGRGKPGTLDHLYDPLVLLLALHDQRAALERLSFAHTGTTPDAYGYERLLS
jgi:hypothetical protein